MITVAVAADLITGHFAAHHLPEPASLLLSHGLDRIDARVQIHADNTV